MLGLSSLDFQHVEKVELGEKVLQPFQILVQDELFQGFSWRSDNRRIVVHHLSPIDFHWQLHRLAGISHASQEFVHAGYRLVAAAFGLP